MPNWCSNSGTIKGSPEVIEKLWEVLKDDPYGLTALFPCPEELTQTMSGMMSEDNPERPAWEAQQKANMEKYGHADWYSWCCDNWGTKWAPEFEFELVDPENISFRGDSAWAPPTMLFLNITKILPVMIDSSYVEEGMAFIGATVYANGKMYDHCQDMIWQESWGGADDPDDIDWQAYYDHQDKVRAECETLAWTAYDCAVPSVPIVMSDWESLFRKVLLKKLGDDDQ